MKKIFLYASCIIVIVAIIGTISFAVIDINKNDANLINEKIIAEVKYLDNTIIEMINKLNNIELGLNINVEKKEEKIEEGSKENSSTSNKEESSSQEGSKEDSNSSRNEESSSQKQENSTKYSLQSTPIMLLDTENIDWNSIAKKAEQMYSSWTTIVIDLNSINVSNENILNFGNNLDNLIINLKNNNKEQSLICLANMYSLLPEYINVINQNSQEYYILKIKAGVLKSFATIYNDKWDLVNEGLSDANNNIESLINSELMLNNPNQTKIQESYVLLKELTKTAKEQNKEMFLLKYVKLMEKMIDF